MEDSNNSQVLEQKQDVLNEEITSTIEPCDDQPMETIADDECGATPANDPQDDSLSQSVNELPSPVESISISEIQQRMVALQEQITSLHEKIDKKIDYDERKDNLFNRMYSELESYKKGLYAKLLEPFVKETIALISDYYRLIERIDTLDHDRLVKFVKGLPEDLETILENSDVEIYEDDTDCFNPKRQRVSGTIPTADPQADNMIAQRIQKGYLWNGIILRPELVRIYKYKEGNAELPPEATSETLEEPNNK